MLVKFTHVADDDWSIEYGLDRIPREGDFVKFPPGVKFEYTNMVRSVTWAYSDRGPSHVVVELEGG
jgi:hypothetical protein